MDNILFESLLNEAEGATLDFKEAQYKFISASEDEKSELLKDILAFANAWRHDKAYILIGVRGEPMSRATPLGIDDHIDDAKLQQFVNAKTNRPVNFKYYSFQFESKSFGVIEIDSQSRPIYLQKKFAKLEAEKVYLRRGSSTAIATPDEIFKMGAATVQQAAPPQVDLQFASTESRSTHGKSIEIESIIFKPHINAAAIRQRIYKNVFGGDNLGPSLQSPLENKEFAVDVFEYEVVSSLTSKADFRLKNNGNQPVTNLKVTITMDKMPNLLVLDALSFPSEPQRMISPNHKMPSNDIILVTELPKSYEASFSVDRLLPGDEFWSEEGIYIGSNQNITLNASVRILADQIPQPMTENFAVTIHTKTVERTLDEWMVMAFEYE